MTYVGRHRAPEQLSPAASGEVDTQPGPGTLRRNVLWNLATGPVVMLGNLALVAVAINVAGAYSYGVWAVAFGATTLLAQADFGIGTALIRQLAAYRAQGAVDAERTCRRYGLILFTGIGLAMAAFLAAGLTAYYVASPPRAVDWELMVAITAVVTPWIFVGRYFMAIVQSHHRFFPERVGGMVSLAVRAMILGTAYIWERSVVSVVIADTCGVLILACAGIVAARRHDLRIRDAEQEREILTTLVTFGLRSFVGSFAGLAAVQVPLYFVGSIVGYSEAAVYAAVMRFMVTAKVVFGWVLGPFLPHVASQAVAGRSAGVQTLFSRAVMLVGFLNAAYVVVMVVAGGDLLRLWLGPNFAGYGLFVAIVGVSILTAALTAPGDTFATAMGYPGVVAWQASLSCLATIVLSAVLARSNGVDGAAAAVLIPLLIAYPVGQWAIRRRTGLRWVWAAVTVAIIAGIGCAAGLGVIAVADAAGGRSGPSVRVACAILAGGGMVVVAGSSALFAHRRRTAEELT